MGEVTLAAAFRDIKRKTKEKGPRFVSSSPKVASVPRHGSENFV
jgi:hypothetical protein